MIRYHQPAPNRDPNTNLILILTLKQLFEEMRPLISKIQKHQNFPKKRPHGVFRNERKLRNVTEKRDERMKRWIPLWNERSSSSWKLPNWPDSTRQPVTSLPAAAVTWHRVSRTNRCLHLMFHLVYLEEEDVCVTAESCWSSDSASEAVRRKQTDCSVWFWVSFLLFWINSDESRESMIHETTKQWNIRRKNWNGCLTLFCLSPASGKEGKTDYLMSICSDSSAVTQ